MTPQECIAQALTAAFVAKNGASDEIIRRAHHEAGEQAVQALLDAGWGFLSPHGCTLCGFPTDEGQEEHGHCKIARMGEHNWLDPNCNQHMPDDRSANVDCPICTLAGRG